MRKLIGVTNEVRDWKLLISDVDRLKEEHVPREIFDEKLERLNGKIKNGLENLEKRMDDSVKALNTRIEDLKAIKSWSKRTLLEIALAIVAAVATLYGAGIIKF